MVSLLEYSDFKQLAFVDFDHGALPPPRHLADLHFVSVDDLRDVAGEDVANEHLVVGLSGAVVDGIEAVSSYFIENAVFLLQLDWNYFLVNFVVFQLDKLPKLKPTPQIFQSILLAHK
jgi:hypothetical protein